MNYSTFLYQAITPLRLLLHSFVVQLYSIIISKGRGFETQPQGTEFCVGFRGE